LQFQFAARNIFSGEKKATFLFLFFATNRTKNQPKKEKIQLKASEKSKNVCEKNEIGLITLSKTQQQQSVLSLAVANSTAGTRKLTLKMAA
jgi:hypothetical protein